MRMKVSTRPIEFLSTRFSSEKIMVQMVHLQVSSGSTQIYMAFAEQPLVQEANNIPSTGRYNIVQKQEI